MRTVTALAAALLTVGAVVAGAPPASAATTATATAGEVVYNPQTGTTGTSTVTITCTSDTDWADVEAGLAQDSGAYASADPVGVPCGTDPVTTTVKMTFRDMADFKAGPATITMIVGDSNVFVHDDTGIHPYLNTTVRVVPPPPMTLTGVAVSPTTFYPRVHDGYRDTTTLSYTLKHPYRTPHVTAKVTNRAGATIRTATLAASGRSWAWGGRNNSGTLAPTGDYKITLTATDPGTPTLRASKWVTSTTGHRYRTTTKTVDGDNGSRATSGDCTAMRDTYEGVMELDCAGGRYARATYGFTLPSSATNLSWKAAGSYPYSDMCCDGKVTKTGTRTTTTHYRVQVNVTGWRAYDVNYALVTYTYRYAI